MYLKWIVDLQDIIFPWGYIRPLKCIFPLEFVVCKQTTKKYKKKRSIREHNWPERSATKTNLDKEQWHPQTLTGVIVKLDAFKSNKCFAMSFFSPEAASWYQKPKKHQQHSKRKIETKKNNCIKYQCAWWLTYLKLSIKVRRWNSRLFSILLKLRHFTSIKYRPVWNSIDASLHILDHHTATMICSSCFDLYLFQ